MPRCEVDHISFASHKQEAFFTSPRPGYLLALNCAHQTTMLVIIISSTKYKVECKQYRL